MKVNAIQKIKVKGLVFIISPLIQRHLAINELIRSSSS
jgi:hypothetical protein